MGWLILLVLVGVLASVLAANEISWQYTLTLTNPSTPPVSGTSYTDKATDQLSLTQTTLRESCGVISIPTTAGGTALPLGGVTTNGLIYLKNTDATNYVTFGIVVSATYYPVVRLKPSESYVWRVDPACTPYLLANTAAVVVAYKLLND